MARSVRFGGHFGPEREKNRARMACKAPRSGEVVSGPPLPRADSASLRVLRGLRQFP